MTPTAPLSLALAALGALLAGGCGRMPPPAFDSGPAGPQLDEVHDRYEVALYTGTETRAQSQVVVDLDLRDADEVRLRARLLSDRETLIDWSLTSTAYHLEPGVDAASAVLVLSSLVPVVTRGIDLGDLEKIAAGDLRVELRQVTLLGVQATFPDGLPVPFPLTARALSLERDFVVR